MIHQQSLIYLFKCFVLLQNKVYLCCTCPYSYEDILATSTVGSQPFQNQVIQRTENYNALAPMSQRMTAQFPSGLECA